MLLVLILSILFGSYHRKQKPKGQKCLYPTDLITSHQTDSYHQHVSSSSKIAPSLPCVTLPSYMFLCNLKLRQQAFQSQCCIVCLLNCISTYFNTHDGNSSHMTLPHFMLATFTQSGSKQQKTQTSVLISFWDHGTSENQKGYNHFILYYSFFILSSLDQGWTPIFNKEIRRKYIFKGSIKYLIGLCTPVPCSRRYELHRESWGHQEQDQC